MAAAEFALPGVGVTDAAWLTEYDDICYARHTSFDLGLPQPVRSLPVLRMKFDDPERAWLYLSPAHAQIVKFESTDRFDRWAYYGLYSLDFGFLFSRRPLWDALVLTLVTGGFVLSATIFLPALRRLRCHASGFGTPVNRRRRQLEI